MEKEIEHTEKLQKEIFEAFNLHFDYCQFYFYHSNQKQKIIDRNYEGVLMNHKKEYINVNIDRLTHRYFAIYGYGHEAGTGNRYNKEGYQIHVLEDNKIKSIKSSIFFSSGLGSSYPGSFEEFWSSFFSKDWKKKEVHMMVIKMNSTLQNKKRKTIEAKKIYKQKLGN